MIGPHEGTTMIHLLIADDHRSVRERLRQVLVEIPDMVVAAEAGDGIEALEKLKRHPIDLVILDVSMPRRGGVETLADINGTPTFERPVR